jgi:Fur family ferric uptake transcriptional regulator
MGLRKLEEVKELFYDYLRQNGLKRTHQKDLILETFLANEGHMSVEDVYALVKRRDKKVGIVTVFRTLKSLTSCGIAKEITLGDGLTRFEHCYYHPLHHHIICTLCNNVIEFLSPELERVQERIVGTYGFQQLHQRIQIYGVCRNCRDDRPSTETRHVDTGKVFARDALRMAMAMQKQGVEFYRMAAAHNQDPAGRAVFEAMMREEEAHAADLQKELDALLKQERGLDEAPIFLHFDQCELHHLLPCLQSNLVGGEMLMDARRSLEIAEQIESRAAGFFKEYSEKFGDTEGKRIFLRFADLVTKHGASINRRAMTMSVAQ